MAVRLLTRMFRPETDSVDINVFYFYILTRYIISVGPSRRYYTLKQSLAMESGRTIEKPIVRKFKFLKIFFFAFYPTLFVNVRVRTENVDTTLIQLRFTRKCFRNCREFPQF